MLLNYYINLVCYYVSRDVIYPLPVFSVKRSRTLLRGRDFGPRVYVIELHLRWSLACRKLDVGTYESTQQHSSYLSKTGKGAVEKQGSANGRPIELSLLDHTFDDWQLYNNVPITSGHCLIN
ncbi:uncharacterized protein EAF01_002348 [Botrytis porri]|uniref:uncharacterized protein n=1 Tax=Botrytis porri TaxID=87229 RepID=UPI0018FFFC5F|nr:uncharacterized protein EAF01_002348 [Botrytis porri]KAF7910839.1 hypothetical protein EAF01_002348 [Botrytis porri]